MSISAGLSFPPDVVDHAIVKNDRLPNHATADVRVFHGLVKNALSPIDSTFVVAEHLSRFGHLGKNRGLPSHGENVVPPLYLHRWL